eukprot:44413-Prymnesium_polylepis.1
MHASPHAAYPHQPNHPGTLVAAWNSLFDDVGAGDLQGFDPSSILRSVISKHGYFVHVPTGRAQDRPPPA